VAVDDSRLAAAIRFVRARALGRLTVPEVVDHAGMSRRSLELGFRKTLGHSVIREITRLRIAHARQRLAATDMPLADIAAECGIEWGTSLSALFRKETGMTPGQYRRRQRSPADQTSQEPVEPADQPDASADQPDKQPDEQADDPDRP
jgi:LacI family transcriptional regulator